MKVETFQAMGAVPVKDGIVFSMERKNNEEASLLLYKKGSKEVMQEIPFPATNTIGDIVCVKAEKIASARYEYNFCIDGKVTLDPYAKVLIGTGKFGEEHPEGHEVRCAMIAGNYDWEDDRKPQIAYEDAVMYSFHVRGFTKQRYSGVRHKGTFLGITEKAEYFKELGINQIKLMPAYEFIEMESVKTHARYRKEEELPKRLNYWGYTKAFHFAPKRAYAATKDPVREFKDMVKTMHRLGIEVLMEFYFPEGCSPRYITECLQYWVQEYHVDGFHVRGVQGICNLMATDPLFADTKLLNIYFPVEEIYGKKNLPKKRMVAECNDGFMIDVRRFLKGDEESLKAFAERMRRNPKGSGLINYIASHDGFTLCDLVSYEERHNEDNGEQNRDGRVQNYSWNCGEEGKSRKKKILELRNRQMKNAWCMLLLSAGTPMILAGDEFCNSQLGNNNPYCLDNEISWLDWKGYKSGNSEMFRFVKDLIAFRKKHKILHMGQELSMTDSLSCGFPGISYHSSSAWYGELDGQNRKIGVMYCGKYADEDELIYIAYNMHWMEHTFALPALPGGYRWNVALDTSEGILEEDKWRLLPDSRQVQVSSRTVIVLIGRKHKDVKESNRTLHNHHKA
ncbi:MAG TPA: hypothetical protein DIV51_01720 [Lachnospiraceae bacterium]|nr:hypothetical protein [Lachnospiraceae bacterium]